MNDEILTTAQTAKLLGVSVRTAQLLIEGGSLPSWKTPGGHRRVYRRDVEAIIDGPNAAPKPSAHVLILAGGTAREELARAAEPLGEIEIDFADNESAALLAIGEGTPAAIIAALADPAAAASFAEIVAHETDIARDRIILIAPGADQPADRRLDGLRRVASADDAIAAMRAILADPPASLVDTRDLPYPVALNEQQRLIALERSGLVDSAPEDGFDRIAWLAANTLDAPIALVTLLTPTRQFFKARVGLDMVDTPRSWAFCNHTIVQQGVFSVEDLSGDARFADNPAVAGDEGFRFYAGAPIRDENGFAIGSLCVIDFAARRLDDRQTRTLAELAKLGGVELRLREARRLLQGARRQAGSRPRHRAKPAPALSRR